MAADTIKLILASASPRRRELLASMGTVFSVQIADIDEAPQPDESARSYVIRMSKHKALAVIAKNIDAAAENTISPARRSSRMDPYVPTAVLAADTIVVQNTTIFGKPRDRQHAFQIWRQLANSKHQVITAVCLAVRDTVDIRTVSTSVEFGDIDDRQMTRYWQSREPQDKAGAYAIQGLASAWVKLIHGSYSNVVGLPLRETNDLLKSIGHNWL